MLVAEDKLLKHKNKYQRINMGGCKCVTRCQQNPSDAPLNWCNRDHMLCYRNKKRYIEALNLKESDFMYATHANKEKLKSGAYKDIFRGVTQWGHGHFILDYEQTDYCKKLKQLEETYAVIKKAVERCKKAVERFNAENNYNRLSQTL